MTPASFSALCRCWKAMALGLGRPAAGALPEKVAGTAMKKYALIGEKLSHSLSPCIHEAVFGELDLEAGYTLMEIPARLGAGILYKSCGRATRAPT